eukprot:s1553_g11.t1
MAAPVLHSTVSMTAWRRARKQNKCSSQCFWAKGTNTTLGSVRKPVLLTAGAYGIQGSRNQLARNKPRPSAHRIPMPNR